MKLFTNEALFTADKRTLELYHKLASLKPTDEFTLDDIEAIMFYIRDYRGELKAEYRRRSEK